MNQLTNRERARRYIASIHSASGSGGHTALFKAALTLRKGFDLPEDEAMEELALWNTTNALPPWNESDLRHKLRDAGASTMAAGYLLEDSPQAANRPSPRKEPSTPFHLSDQAGQRAAKRQQWPAFRIGTQEEISTVANLRKIQPGIVWMAQSVGLLRFTTSKRGEACFVLTEGTLAQVRRMDGEPFKTENEAKLKSRNLPGSVGKWLGYRMLERHCTAPVLIVEGLIAWLEAAEAIVRSDSTQWLPFAALSASVSLEPRELTILAGRRVIIARDRAMAGLRAAKRWQEELRAAGITAPYWTPPLAAGEKADLGDALRLPDFDPSTIFHTR